MKSKKEKKEINELKVVRKERVVFIIIAFILCIVNMLFIHSSTISGIILGIDMVVIVELTISSYILNRNSKIILDELKELVKENSRKDSQEE